MILSYEKSNQRPVKKKDRQLSCIVIEMRNLGGKFTNSVSGKFDVITISIEKFQNIESIAFEEIICTLKILEDKLKDHFSKRKKRLFSLRQLGKSKRGTESSNRRIRGRHDGRARGRSSSKEGKGDKSKVTSYNCRRKGNYANVY